MITLHGKSVCKGFAIAEAVILPPSGGVSDIPHGLLERGIAAIKRRIPESDMPQVVVVCESATDGFALRLPGINVAAVVAELCDGDSAGCSMPCVTGISDLLRDATDGDIVIVDGTRGIVYLDPDADTLIHYQSAVDSHKTRRIFLESRHLPAITQDGKPVSVFAVANCGVDIPSSLDEGADGVVIPKVVVDEMATSDWRLCLELAAGKPLVMLSPPNSDCLRQVMSQSLPGQVTVAFSCDDQQDVARFQAEVDAISTKLLSEGIEPAEPTIAVIVDARNEQVCGESLSMVPRLIVHAGGCDATAMCKELRLCVVGALSGQDSTQHSKIPATVILGSSIDAVSHLPVVVDTVATPVGLVGATKDLIRSFPLNAES